MSNYPRPELRSLATHGGRLLAAGDMSRHEMADSSATLLGEAKLFCGHIGPSMNPTLNQLDLLEVEPYLHRPLSVGDVVLFLPPGDEKPVVHRVISRNSAGLRTRGDNNPVADPYLIDLPDITGRVVAAWRGQHRRKIPGGRFALFRINLLRRLRALDRRLCALLFPLYDAAARSGLTRPFFPARLRPRLLAFDANGRRRLKLLLGRHIIGHYDEARGCWLIRRPFRLFVDEQTLPGPPDPLPDHPRPARYP